MRTMVLVGRYERLVFSVALRNGESQEEAADVAQMTFVALLESIGRLRDGDRLASWLMSVARRPGRPASGIGPARARCLRRLRALLGEDARS